MLAGPRCMCTRLLSRGDRCLVTDQLGPGWQFEYRVKWEMLPVIISRALHAQLAKYHSSRLVDVSMWSEVMKDTFDRNGESDMHGGGEGMQGGGAFVLS